MVWVGEIGVGTVEVVAEEVAEEGGATDFCSWRVRDVILAVERGAEISLAMAGSRG